MRIGYLGLCSNLGNRRGQMQAAVEALPASGVHVLASSSTYDTDAVGSIVQPAFLDACVQIETELGPEELLDAVRAVERGLGHDADDPRPLPGRPIGIEVLLLGDLEHRSPRMRLPHEQVLTRRFVLVPLLELDPDLTTPDGRSLAEALERLPRDARIRDAGPPLFIDY